VVHGNYDFKRNQFDWTPGKPQNLPASLFYSAKPAWFGSIQWPPIGPDPTNPSVLLTGTIPAKVRYEGGADTIPPTVSITAPTEDSTVLGSVMVSANAADSGGVAGVQFKLNGTNLGAEDTSGPYQINWDTRSYTNSSYTLTATARDISGNTATSAPVTVTVANTAADTIAPMVSITAPTNGSTVSRNSTVTIRATASDNIRVTKVEFYINGNLVRTDTSAAYTYRWDVPRARGQSYRLQAKAYDTAGNVGASNIVTVTSSQ
jgi:hypothetical protein